MTRIKLCACVTITMLTVLLGAVVGSASAQTLVLEFHVRDLRAPAEFSITYHSGVKSASGSSALAQEGGIGQLTAVDNGIHMRAAGSDPLTATIAQFADVGTAPVTGIAEIPSGVTATVKNTLTGETTTLTNGSFRFDTGVVAAKREKNSARRHAERHSVNRRASFETTSELRWSISETLLTM
jgi:hypothetical protein